MFITVQFPLVDYRNLQDISTKLDRPEWPDPDPEEDSMLYFGRIFNGDIRYDGPWDGEKRYCNVKGVMNFCGVENRQFYGRLGVPWQSRIGFRRFQSDGKFLAKFEVGFFDDFEILLREKHPPPEQIRTLLYEHINEYLQCEVKIKKGSKKYKTKDNRYTDFVPLIHAGSHLANSYYWSTYKGEAKRTFDEKVRKDHIVKCDPIVIVQLDDAIFDVSQLAPLAVDTSDLLNPGLRLFFDYVPHSYQKNNYQIKTWFLATRQLESSFPAGNDTFKKYDDTIRKLRINLIRIHSEIIVLKKVLERIGKQKEGYLLENPAVKKRTINYLHKIFFNLSKYSRNSQPQQNLVQVAIRLEETVNQEDSLEDQIKGLELVIEELKKMNDDETTQRVTNYSYKYYITVGDQITIGTIHGNFINKSHLVNSLNSSVNNNMSEEFRQELLQIAKMIEDSKNELAANIMNTINEEFAKPEPEQKKSKIKSWWDGLVKIMPDILTIGKTVAAAIALF